MGAAPPTRALAGVSPGLWEVSRSASGERARRICLAQVEALAAIAHPGERCGRTVLRNVPGELVTHLTCKGGDFARSTIRVTTPRSLKVQTQGIHRGEPFDLALYARRVGDCRPGTGRR